jgi:hypothetical protein
VYVRSVVVPPLPYPSAAGHGANVDTCSDQLGCGLGAQLVDRGPAAQPLGHLSVSPGIRCRVPSGAQARVHATSASS